MVKTVELIGGPLDGLVVAIPNDQFFFGVHRAIELSWNPLTPVKIELYLYQQRSIDKYDYIGVVTDEELQNRTSKGD